MQFAEEGTSLNNTSQKEGLGKSALIIIGMHRSGTSATTGALRCLGVQLGRKLYAGHKNINDKGYFEHSDIADTNEEVLLSIGSSWDDILLKPAEWWKRDSLSGYASKIKKYFRRDFSRSPLWAIKDPRVCRMLPWWLDILGSEGVAVKFLFVIRSPEAVFRSLEKRDGFSRDKAYLLWTLHYLEAERASRGMPRTFMDFDSFLDAPRREFERASEQLRLEFPISPEKATECLAQFLSKDLRHHKSTESLTKRTELIDLGLELHKILLAATRTNSAQVDIAAMDVLDAKMTKLQHTFSDLLVEQLHAISTKRGEQQITLEKLVRSWSWYTGKPVRYLERIFGRDV